MKTVREFVTFVISRVLDDCLHEASIFFDDEAGAVGMVSMTHKGARVHGSFMGLLREGSKISPQDNSIL